ncbi:MAG: MarR family transcriptional regulator [Novosphingobium sp.]|nr:MarR family transcriptional regulator [Novosphingobium sp.]
MPGDREAGSKAIDIPNDLKTNIGLRFTVLARMLRNQFDRRVASLGVTRSQWSMIAVVARKPGATQRVIAEALEMSEASAGRLIDKLCAEGFLERRERDDDRRARAVFLTDAATPMLEKLAEIGKQSEEVMFKGFTDEDLDNLLAYLDKIYENIVRQ